MTLGEELYAPGVSVLMATYRGDNLEHLSLAVQSIFEQTVQPDQLVLVVDGPVQPRVEEFITALDSQRHCVTVVWLESNQGLAKALNIGWDLCAHRYVMRMDADDWSHPERLRKQSEFLDLHTEIDIVGGAVRFFGTELTFVQQYPKSHEQIVRYLSRAMSPFAHPAVMFRNGLKRRGITYSSEVGSCEDIDLWYRCFFDGRLMANLPDVILDFRFDTGTVGRRGLWKGVEEFKIYNRHIQKLHGWSWRSVFPVLRFIHRCLPYKLTVVTYRLRNFLSNIA